MTDAELASKFQSWESFHKEIQTVLNLPGTSALTKRHVSKIQFFPQPLALLAKTFAKLVAPLDVHFKLVWGLLFVNLEYSYTSQDTLRRTSDLMIKIRRTTEKFNRSLDVCDQSNEAVIAIVEFLDPIIIILTDSIAYYHEYPPGMLISKPRHK